MSISEREWDEAVRAIASASQVALACHVGPDGDALGSMLALGLALRARETEVVASWGGEPFEVPRQYAFMPGQDLLASPDKVPEAPELMVTFDAGSLERLGTLAPNARAARALIVVDHHASNDRFGTLNLVDPDMAASAGLVFRLLERLGIPLNRDIATCLYTGIVTDTGRFQYSATTPEIHRMAAELLAQGVAHDEITRVIYETHSVGYLRVAAQALARLDLRADDGVVWTWVTQRDLRDAGVGLEDTEALIDLIRTADVADVAAVLKEQPDGRYRVSMRSKGANDVGALCERFGGGGHRLAAGFVSRDGDPRGTVDEIVAVLRAGA